MRIKERTKAGIVGVVGRPSVGKSTLLNCICKAPVSITSALPQTTRNQIRGIYTEKRGQIVFLDTPGLHTSRKRFNRHLSSLVRRTLEDCEVIVYLLDCSRAPGEEESYLATMINTASLPYLWVFNKTDHPRANPSAYDALRASLRAPAATLHTSARRKEGIDELCTALFSLLPESPLLYPQDVYTDQDPSFRITEIIRAEALRFLHQELPYSLFVSCTGVLNTTRTTEGDICEQTLLITLYVEEESHKGILVGKGGSMIGKIREGSEKALEKLFPYPIKLRLRVQRKAGWRSDEKLLKKLIF